MSGLGQMPRKRGWPHHELPLWQIAVVQGIFVVAAAAIIYLRRSGAAVVFRMPLLTEVAIGLPLGAALGAAVGFGLLHSRLRGHVVRGTLPLRPLTSAVWSIAILGVLASMSAHAAFDTAILSVLAPAMKGGMGDSAAAG